MVCCASSNPFDGDRRSSARDVPSQPVLKSLKDSSRLPGDAGSAEAGELPDDQTADTAGPLWKRIASRLSRLVIAACRGPLVC